MTNRSNKQSVKIIQIPVYGWNKGLHHNGHAGGNILLLAEG